MKVAFLVGYFPALSETFIINQITGLLDRGCQVEIYAYQPLKSDKVHPQIQEYRLLDRTHYIPLPNHFFQRVLQALRLLSRDFFGHPVLLLRSLNIFRYGKLALSLRLLFDVVFFLHQRQNYDLIHCHFGPNGTRATLLRELGVFPTGQLITTFHGYDISASIRAGGKQVYAALIAHSDRLIAISEHMRKQLIDLGSDPQRTIVQRIGIDAEKFSFTPRYLPKEGPVQIVSIARLVEKKGLEYGIRAVAKVSQTQPNLRYSIIGDGPLKQPLQNLIHELGMANTVQLLGSQTQEAVLELLKQAHLGLVPSVTAANGDQEGIPVALMEAMAAGLPIISTLHSGIPEVVEDGVSGFLVPERDVDALADRLSYLIAHPEQWVAMGQAGRQTIEQHYSSQHLSDQLIHLYQQVLASDLDPSA